MLRARFIPYSLRFNFDARTSRGPISEKRTYFIEVWDTESPTTVGRGEVPPFNGLGENDTPEFRRLLSEVCRSLKDISLNEVPSSAIRFGVETALSDLSNGGQMKPFDIDDSFEIPINGLVWMGDMQTMANRIRLKINEGYSCIKIKIGGIDFGEELELLRQLRMQFNRNELEIRLDANGAFPADKALNRIEMLSKFDIHSLEQPIQKGQTEQMAALCHDSPIPIALDEELIGITPHRVKRQKLDFIKPSYIILKPSLCGGLAEADDWINAANETGIGYWTTSALESNIGLNAIARWVNARGAHIPQGLGTGALYSNNIPSPLSVHDCKLTNTPNKWTLPIF